MDKKITGLILAGMLLLFTACGGSKSMVKSYVRENADLGLIRTIAVLPFEGGGRAPRHRELTITQLLSSGIFEVVDKGRVDYILQQEAITAGTPLDSFTLRRLGEMLEVNAVLHGSVEQVSESRGSSVFPEITMTMRLIECESGQLLWQASGKGSGYSLADRLFGFAPKDSFQVTLKLLDDLFSTMQ